MTFIILLTSAIVILVMVYLNCIRPNNGRQNYMEPFEKHYIAHRGLFNNNDAPENSMIAFSRAIEHGYGIELDVQLTADNQLVVFHDESLERMCGDKRILHKTSYADLSELNLLDTEQKIPLLKDVLTLIDGLVPLVIEIKPEGRYIQTTQHVNEMLSNYNGRYCVQSLHPFVLLWYRKHNKNILRGQLSTDYSKDKIKKAWFIRFILTNLLLNFLGRPDFIAYNHNYKNQFSYAICRRIYNTVNVAWTIKNQKQLEKAKDSFQIFIFENFIPD